MRYKDRYSTRHVVGSKQTIFNLGKEPSSDIRRWELEKFAFVKDRTSPYPYTSPNPLHIHKKEEGCIRANGSHTQWFLWTKLRTTVYNSYPIKRLYPRFGIDSLTPISGYATEAVSRSSPYRSDYDIGELIQSLYELPKLAKNVRDAINRFAKKDFSAKSVSDAYLANEFGIAPTIDDVRNLLEIQSQLARAARRIAKAKKGESFSGTLHEHSDTWTERDFFVSYDTWFSYDVTYSYQNKVWYSIVYDMSGLELPDPKLTQLARTLGVDKPLSSLWNLTRMSFLIDYFVDFSSWINLRYAPAVRHICIMHHQKATAKGSGGSFSHYAGPARSHSGDLRLNYVPALHENKRRYVYNTATSVPITTFVNLQQVANIIALVAQRS